tara:strand:- start:953 stop:1954 length:1002 start_codon:yes stop_codon:yes gene_type:complete
LPDENSNSMNKRPFSPFEEVSALTLGGGGLGQVWGETTREEAIATVNLALKEGINHFDVAPMYGKGEAERVLGEVFKRKNLDGLNFTTKCSLGTLPDKQVYGRLNLSLTESLSNMNMEKVNLFLLHSQLREDDFELSNFNEMRDKNTTSLSSYFNAVIPAFEKLKQEGKIEHWGIGGMGQHQALVKAINYETPPEAIQCVLNPLNSAGAIGYVDENYDPSTILNESQVNDLPILAIRAVQAGALTNTMDREPHPSGFDQKDFADYARAAPFRELAAKWGQTSASLAHRYALSVPKVSSVILGVKNRIELQECIEAEKKGVLTAEQFNSLDNLF